MSLPNSGTVENVSAQASAEVSSFPVLDVDGIAVMPIGALLVIILIAIIVLGIHRLVHRRQPHSPAPRTRIERSRQNSLPYLQPKAELEDEQRRRHELHGENFAYELNGEGEIVQSSDGTESHVLPVQRRQEIQEMPEGNPMSWELPLHERHEVLGDEYAQELGSPMQNKRGSVVLEHLQEPESAVEARDEPAKAQNADGPDSPVQDPAPGQHKSSTRDDLIRSHFMLRQQQMPDRGGLAVVN
ncbi:hypothetical protein BDR22DRAFT_823301 [Usnea florida]